jgi:hypothetical protein
LNLFTISIIYTEYKRYIVLAKGYGVSIINILIILNIYAYRYRRKELSQLLFPNTKNTEEYIKQYPKRNLPEGTEVTRFAPSPTGFIHMGGIYTSMISRDIAKQTNGIFILRIEDTDKTREIENGVEQIAESLVKYNLLPDEGIMPNNEIHGEYGHICRARD